MGGYSDASYLSHGNSSRAGMTRRDVLRALAAGSTALAGAPLLASFGIDDTAIVAARARAIGQAVDVTLVTVSDVPYPGIPTAEEQAADPSLKAYAEAVQPWMDENPGVKLEQIEFDVYDQQALLVAISGGTAPSFYPAEVLASWNEELVLAAEKSGLAADVTDQVARTTSRRSSPTTVSTSGKRRKSRAGTTRCRTAITVVTAFITGSTLSGKPGSRSRPSTGPGRICEILPRR